MKPRILIIEDDPIYTAIIMQQLRKLGFDHLANFPTCEEALAGISERFDLALVDLRLASQIDGIETARRLRELHSIESVLMTGLADQQLIERALNAQPYGFLSKPFDSHTLKIAVEMALQRLRAERALREREEQLATVLKTSMDSFFVLSLDGRFLEVNEAACKMTGYTREELLQKNLVELEYGRTAEQIATGIEFIAKNGAAQIERLTRRKDGHIRLIDMSITCTPAPLRRLYCFGRDITERRLSENSLREREQHLRAIIDNIPDAAWLKDLQGRYLAVNAVWCRYYNHQPEAVLGKTDYDFFPAEQAASYWQRDEQVRKSGAAICTEVEHITAEGATVWLEVRKAPFFDSKNNCIGLVGITRDVTERRKAELRLQLLKRAVEQSPASIVITDTHGAIEYVNPYFEKNAGYSLQEVVGHNPRILNSGTHTPEFFQNLWSTISSGQEWRGEIHNRRKDGSFYWEQAFISPMRNENGEIVNYVAVKEDITERKATELTMAWQSALFENSIDICCVKDLNLRVLTANKAMARAAGVDSPRQLVGRTDADIFRASLSAEDARSFMDDERAVQSLHPGQVLVRQERLHTADKKEHILLTRKFPVFNNSGKLIATANISTDITELKRVERDLIRAKEEAEAANVAKSTFLATMSHELRTPLNVINGMAAILAQSSWPPEQQHAIEMISEGGNTLLTIIEEILDYSGLQAGKTKLELAPFSLLAITSNALRLFAATARSKGLQITCSLDPNTPAEVIGDARRLQQVLVNLLQNSVKFTERGRIHLKLSLLSQTDGVYTVGFSVLDTGIGIAPANLAKLFQPFTQADGTITRRFGGTGLGLAISKSFIQLMGGAVAVRSRVGRGSLFSFTIQLAATANKTTAFEAQARPVFNRRRVLIPRPKGAQQRTLLALLRAWQMQPVIIQAVHNSSPSPCDIALLPVPNTHTHHAIPVSNLPTVWMGLKDATTDKSQAVRCVCNTLDISELSTAFADLLAPPAREPTALPLATATPSSAPSIPLPIAILAAEDNRTNREVIKLVLKHIGYTADLVVNGAEAVEAVQRKHYDLVLMDVQMPVMDGLSAAAEICRLMPDPEIRPKICALTANALPGDRERCLSSGMDDYLSKPILPADLRACIHRHFKKDEPADVRANAAHAGSPKTKNTQAEAAGSPNSQASPLIDRAHLETITAGMTQEQVIDTLTQLQSSVCNDFSDTITQIVEVCAGRNQKTFAETVHGLKGCFMMTGWARAGKRCAQVIAEARQGNFKDWASFPDELRELYAISNQAMTAHLSSLQMQNQECHMPK